MSSENRMWVAAHRKYHQGELESMIRQMKIEGGTVEDCVAELNILADFVRSKADSLPDDWPNLLKDTYYERWEQRKNETETAGVPMPESED